MKKYSYFSRNNDWGGFGVGYDLDEVAAFDFRLSICVPHRYLFFEFGLLGLSLDAHVFERDKEKIDDGIRP